MEILVPFLIFIGIGALIGLLLALASRFFSVKSNPLVDELTEALPGANCGACGYAGCRALAEAMARGEAPTNACTAGGSETARKTADIMGVPFNDVVEQKAFVLCRGCDDKASKKYIYKGLSDCVAAAKLGGGDKNCIYGCLGLGSCVSACQFDAISVIDGVAVVDREKCTGCGMCAEICPKDIISMLPSDYTYAVACASKDKAKQVRAVCDVGCIACRLCEKKCNYDAVSVINGVAVIDQDKCTACGVCAKVCPRKIITTGSYIES